MPGLGGAEKPGRDKSFGQSRDGRLKGLRVAVRNIRREVQRDLRELKSEGEAGEDDERRAEAGLQKLTDDAVGEIETLLKGKEEEILEV